MTYYVLTASGGLWKTMDAGTHFEPSSTSTAP